MLETKMSNKMKQLFPWIMMQNIENLVGLGTPDKIYGYEDVQGWIEYKNLDDRVPVRSFTMPWEPGQLAWHHRYKVKYKNTSPYILIFTIKDSWYFITDLIKEKYSMAEILPYYMCETKDLNMFKDTILNILFPTR